MHLRFNSIGIVFVCLLIFIGLILDTQTEARTLSHSLRAGALRNMHIHKARLRTKRALAGEQDDDDDDNLKKRNEYERYFENLFSDNNMALRSNDDQNEELGERHTQNNDEDFSLNNEFETRVFNNDNFNGDEDSEKREFNDEVDDDKKRK